MRLSGRRLCATIFSVCLLAVAAVSFAQGPSADFPVRLVPNARSIAVSFDVRNVAPALYEIRPSPWEFEGEARLWLSTDNGVTWKRQPDFVREQVDKVDAPNKPQSPRMSSRIFGLAPGNTYRYRITFAGGGWPQNLVKEGECRTTPLPRLGPNVTAVKVEAKDTTATLQEKIMAAFAMPDTDVVELRSSLANPAAPLMVRASIGQVYTKWTLPSGTPDRWKSLRVAKGHNIIFDGSDPAFAVKDAGNWVPYVDPAKGITAAMGVYKSRIPIAREWEKYVYYERREGEPSVQSYNISPGNTSDVRWFSGFEKYSTGFDSPEDTPIARIKGDTVVLDTPINKGWHWAMELTIAGNSNPAANRAWVIGDWTHDGLKFVLRDPETGKKPDLSEGVGGVVKARNHTSTALTRIQRNSAFHIYEDDGTGNNRGYLYLRLHDAVDPNTTRIFIPTLKDPMYVVSQNTGRPLSYFTIENFQIQHFQQAGSIYISGASSLWFRNIRMWSTAGFIATRSSQIYNVVVEGGDFRQRGVGPDPYPNPTPVSPWRYSKAGRYESTGFDLDGVGVSLIDNHIEGMHNGWTAGGPDPASYPLGWEAQNDIKKEWSEAIEIDGNTFVGIGDDSVEPEVFLVNVSVTDNTFRMCYKGVSMAPAAGGPYYILRNKWFGGTDFAMSDASDQSFLKMGNDTQMTDSGYKLIAHNSIVNVNTTPGGRPVFGIMGSGASYNQHVYNNYVATDTLAIFNYGANGYPHLYDNNRYRLARMGDVTGLSSDNAGFALMERPFKQGDNADGKRVFKTFEDWQRGVSHVEWRHMPGAVPAPAQVPQVPVVVKTAGTDNGPSQVVTWMHDPHSTFGQGRHELMAPQAGNFAPVTTKGWNRGRVMYGINTDVGPEWARYEERVPTIGAVPADPGQEGKNAPPVVHVDALVVGAVDQPVAVVVTYEDYDGVAEIASAVVTDPKGGIVPSKVETFAEGVASVIFTPTIAGPHPVKVTVRDDRGATAQDVATVNVTPALPPDERLQITLSASKQEPQPGEPVVYTIVVENPTKRAMSNSLVRQNLPAEMTVNTASISVDGRATAGSFANGVLQVPLGTIPPGEKRTITVTAFVR